MKRITQSSSGLFFLLYYKLHTKFKPAKKFLFPFTFFFTFFSFLLHGTLGRIYVTRARFCDRFYKTEKEVPLDRGRDHTYFQGLGLPFFSFLFGLVSEGTRTPQLGRLVKKRPGNQILGRALLLQLRFPINGFAKQEEERKKSGRFFKKREQRLAFTGQKDSGRAVSCRYHTHPQRPRTRTLHARSHTYAGIPVVFFILFYRGTGQGDSKKRTGRAQEGRKTVQESPFHPPPPPPSLRHVCPRPLKESESRDRPGEETGDTRIHRLEEQRNFPFFCVIFLQKLDAGEGHFSLNYPG